MDEKEKFLTEMKDMRTRYEEEYGISLTAREVFQLKNMDFDEQICAGCEGLPCRKLSEAGMRTTAKVENGQLYLTMRPCLHQAAADARVKSIAAGVPSRYAGKRLTSYKQTPDNKQAIKMARWYHGNKTKEWPYLYGECGTGKTHLASIIASEHVELGYEVLFVEFQDLLEELKKSFDDKQVTADDVLKKYQTCEMLILDDVGTGYFRDWGVSVLHQLINYRYNEEKRTVLTSNYDFDGLERRLKSQEEYAARRRLSNKGTRRREVLGDRENAQRRINTDADGGIRDSGGNQRGVRGGAAADENRTADHDQEGQPFPPHRIFGRCSEMKCEH